MRLVVFVAVVCVAACASEKLERAPPAGVDFSGRWKLNEADSDDPQRLINTPATGQSTSAGSGGGPGGGGSGGRGGGRQGGGRGGGGGMNPGGSGGPAGPAIPPVSALKEGLRWPGKQVEVKQVAGVVAFTSDGINRVCQPMDGGKPHRHHADANERDSDTPGRGTRAQGRADPPPAHCGWAEKTLIVQGGDPDDERAPFEEHYSLSEDGQRLVEVVSFKGGRSNGFTASRVWDRSVQ